MARCEIADAARRATGEPVPGHALPHGDEPPRRRTDGPAAGPPAGRRREPRQLALGIEGDQPAERQQGPVHREVLPDVVHIAGWLDHRAQRALVEQFRTWAEPPAGLRHPRVPQGHLMSVQSVCLGWHWQPYAYSRTADDTDGAPVKPLPASLLELGARAVLDAFGPASAAGTRLRARRGHRQPLRAPGPPRPPPGRRGALRRSGGHHQPRRPLRVPHGRRRSAHRPLHRRRAVLAATSWCSVAPTVGSTTASPR